MPPTGFEWMIGKREAEIRFVEHAEEYIRSNTASPQTDRLEDFVDRIKSGDTRVGSLRSVGEWRDQDNARQKLIKERDKT